VPLCARPMTGSSFRESVRTLRLERPRYPGLHRGAGSQLLGGVDRRAAGHSSPSGTFGAVRQVIRGCRWDGSLHHGRTHIHPRRGRRVRRAARRFLRVRERRLGEGSLGARAHADVRRGCRSARMTRRLGWLAVTRYLRPWSAADRKRGSSRRCHRARLGMVTRNSMV
jgi:hypothetical protein